MLCGGGGGGGGYKGARDHPVVRAGAQRTLRPGSVPYPNGPMGYDKGRGGIQCVSSTYLASRTSGLHHCSSGCFVISSTIVGISPLVKGSEDLPLPVVDPAETSVVVPWTVVVPSSVASNSARLLLLLLLGSILSPTSANNFFTNDFKTINQAEPSGTNNFAGHAFTLQARLLLTHAQHMFSNCCCPCVLVNAAQVQLLPSCPLLLFAPCSRE